MGRSTIDHTYLLDSLPEENTKVVLDGGSWKDVTNSILDIVDIAICSIRFKMPDHDTDQTISYMLNKGVEFIVIKNN